MTAHGDFLRRNSRSRDADVAAVADNCRFDERAGTERWNRFDALLPDRTKLGGTIDWMDWAEANQLHLDRYCNVPSLSVPDAFLEINRNVWLDGLSGNQSLVRIEAIARPLQSSNLDLGSFIDLLKRADDGDGDAAPAVRSFVDAWNQRRDARPTFAAFYDEVQHEADDDDWPHALRDRLGLGHYGLAGGTELPVALMRYSLGDVFSAQADRGLSAACALPTVLDGGMHEFFFPVPKEHPYGATVHLVPGRADALTAEIVHCRIDYRRKHLSRLGTIKRPHQLTDDQLRDARDVHLLALRVECRRDDFGETLAGRT